MVNTTTTVKQLNCRRNTVYILCFLATFSFYAMVISVFFVPNFNQDVMFVTMSSTYSLLTLVYVLTIMHLLKMLSRLCRDGMEIQTKSVAKEDKFRI